MRLTYTVDAGYIKGEPLIMQEGGGMIGYQFSYRTEGLVREMSAEGAPLWQASLAVGQPNMIHGYPYVVNYNMPEFGPTNKFVAFGNFSYHMIRRVREMNMFVFFDSMTAQNYASQVVCFARIDSRFIGGLDTSGKSEAVKHLLVKNI